MGRDIQAQAKQIIRIMTDDKVDDTSEEGSGAYRGFPIIPGRNSPGPGSSSSRK